MLIGHANHPEVIGTMGQLKKGSVHLIETISDAKQYKNEKEKKLAYITQTTLSIDDASEIIKTLKKISDDSELENFELFCSALFVFYSSKMR